MHVSKADLEPTVIGKYEGGLEPYEVHDRTMAAVTHNMGAVAG